MNMYYLILWQLMLIGIFGEQFQYGNMTSQQLSNKFRYKRSGAHKELTLKVKIGDEIQTIKMVATNQILANKNLNVWLSSTGDPDKLKDIMKDHGGFSMYHDYFTKSAVVHFYTRREIAGVVNMQYKIQIQVPNGRSDILNNVFELNTKDLIDVRKYFESSTSGTNLRKEYDATSSSLKLEIYPELLVAISHNMFHAIEKHSQLRRGVKTVSHVITVYNIVDMMFKFVRSADISLNIAGIVIEKEQNDWGFSPRNVPASSFRQVNLNRKISNYFQQFDDLFRQYSYDTVAYHTRNNIQTVRSEQVPGIACCEHYSPMHRPHGHYYRYNLAVEDFESFEHYPIIVQELAHTLGADFDRMNSWFFNQPCNRKEITLQDPSLCMKWNDEIEIKFQNYFRSPGHCVLKNKPSSQDSDKPMLSLTATEQCQCYGHQSSYGTQGILPEDGCSRAIKCNYKTAGAVANLPYPMDGTPCKSNLKKVCWRKKCVDL